MPPQTRVTSVLLGVALMIAGPACKTDSTAQAPVTETTAGGEKSGTGPVRFGVLPAVGAAELKAAYAPLTAEMSKALGRPVEVVVSKDYNGLVADLAAGKVDCAQLSIFAFVKGAALRLRQGAETHVLAQERRAEKSRHYGVIAARKNDGVKALADLKGKRFVYVDEASSSGFYYPRMFLRQKGLDPDGLFAETLFAGSHDQARAMIAEGKADAGALSARSFGADDDLAEIGRTDNIPDDVIVSLSGLTNEERTKLTTMLLDAHTNAALTTYRSKRGVERYVPGDVREYAAQRDEMLRAAEVKRGKKAQPKKGEQP